MLSVIVALAVAITTLREVGKQWFGEKSFSGIVSGCKDDKCIASALSDVLDSASIKEAADSSEMVAGQMAGGEVRSSQRAMALLHKLYGVDSSFLGTGHSKPAGLNYDEADFREYLVRNYPDTDKRVLVWKLTGLQYLHNNLYETLIGTSPLNGPAKLKEMGDEIKRGVAYHADPPALIRFARIPAGKYSGCLGRKEAHWVFASELGSMKDRGLTIEQATKMSGYEAPPVSSDELYVFVIVPTDAQDLMRPTWKEILSNVSTEVATQSYCTAAATAAP